MRYIFKQKPTGVKTFINPVVEGVAYLGKTEIYFGQDGPVTVEQMYMENPDMFHVVDTISLKSELMVNLTKNYAYLHEYYGNPTEEAMAQKISDLAEKILSKI